MVATTILYVVSCTHKIDHSLITCAHNVLSRARHALTASKKSTALTKPGNIKICFVKKNNYEEKNKNHAHPNNTIGAKHPVFLGKNPTIRNLKTPVSWITHAHRVILPMLRVASPINIADFPPTKNALALHEFLISRARSHQPLSTHLNMTGQSGWIGSKQSKAMNVKQLENGNIAHAA